LSNKKIFSIIFVNLVHDC